MKKITEECEEALFRSYDLTDLMLLEVNGRKKYNKILENSALYELLSQKLQEYGVGLFGSFKTDEGNMVFRCIRLLEGFPIENEPIIDQLYGFDNLEVHIQLNGFDEFATAFNYNTTTRVYELQQHCWGSVKVRIKYNTLQELLEAIGDRKEETYIKLFDEI